METESAWRALDYELSNAANQVAAETVGNVEADLINRSRDIIQKQDQHVGLYNSTLHTPTSYTAVLKTGRGRGRPKTKIDMDKELLSIRKDPGTPKKDKPVKYLALCNVKGHDINVANVDDKTSLYSLARQWVRSNPHDFSSDFLPTSTNTIALPPPLPHTKESAAPYFPRAKMTSTEIEDTIAPSDYSIPIDKLRKLHLDWALSVRRHRINKILSEHSRNVHDPSEDIATNMLTKLN
ncbi:hypothetical protein PROFUN_10110 [Planoprotostelium fungivorum]|uniref:Uncharacterized protein n=1 Tax=Planoprotostelium fungivorum TaxID=1890364 RepID=A0A2P6NEN1_9EUKA|nr:hypothetical protein PROFUN_10110 [Planoprotostelium fungivorum]